MVAVGSNGINIAPSAKTPRCLTYVLDFSTGAYGATNLQHKPYFDPFDGDAAVIDFRTVNLVLPQPGDVFGAVRSAAFSFRPYHSSLGDYQQNNGKIRFDYIPFLALFNNSTFQTLFIQAKNLVIPNATVAAAVTSYVPRLLIHQGAAPFFAALQDSLEVTCINYASDNLGKLILNLFNFDVPPWYETTFDQLVTAN